VKTLVCAKFHFNRSSFGSVSHPRTEFRAAEINTRLRHGFGSIRNFRCPFCNPFVLLVSCVLGTFRNHEITGLMI
jgi:hypothetical protein